MTRHEPAPALEGAFRAHERFLWGLAYRMTGSALDADDVVQETFVRAIRKPPKDLDRPLRPWLSRVAIRVSTDALRARKRRGYVGPWLPSPVETSEGDLENAGSVSAETRYDAREAASFAFLVALEALTPRQRGVLLLCDVFDYSVSEAAKALGMTQANVKVTHHRARRAMAAYDKDRPPRDDLPAKTRAALERFLAALVAEDAAAAETCLAEDVRALSDGGGEYLAALLPIKGPDRVTRFFLGAQRRSGVTTGFAVRAINGLPAVVAEVDPQARFAPRFVLRCDLNAEGLIRELHLVVASRKLSAVRPLHQEGAPTQ